MALGKTSREKERSVFSSIALGTYAAQTNQLQLLSEILWRNSVSLTNKRYNLANNDLATLKFYLHLYSSAIDRMNTEHDVRSLIAIAAEKQGGNRTVADVEHELRTNYFAPVKELRTACDEIESIDEESIDEGESMLRRGRAWMLLGYLQLLLFGNLDLIDPVRKVEMRLKYLEEDIADCERMLYVTALQDRILGVSTENEYAHPRLTATKNCKSHLLKMRDDLSCLRAFRPSSVSFTSLSRDACNFRKEVGSYKLVQQHMSKLSAIASKIAQNCESADLIIAESASREAEIWSLSIQRFAEQIEVKYLAVYPDVVLPLTVSLSQLRHGVCILINELQRLVSARKSGVADLDSTIYNLIRFPTIGPLQESLLNLSALCVSKDTRALISEGSYFVDAFIRMREQFRIFKSGLHELHNHVILNRNLTKSLWRDVNTLLQQIVLIWKQQQQEEEKQAAEKESLYKNKIESYGETLTEEEELKLEVHRLFPTHREKDFYDIEDSSEPSLDQKNAPSEPNENFGGLITKDDIREIQRIHSNIVTSFIACKWMCDDSVSTTTVNYIEPLVQRYDTVYGILDDVLPCMSERLTVKLYNSLNLLVALGLQASQDRSVDHILCESTDGRRTKAYDFYQDGNVKEVKQCLPLCESILNRVGQLLEEWPDHPTLRSIRCIIDRIYTFPITSAVSRFLTGLELLLVKMHQWEENAHSGVSMTDYVLALTQQIISWRKLELSCWKGCLDATFDRLRSNTSKWWFFLYALIESYITRSTKNDVGKTNDEPITRQKLIDSLERFMNESSLVEFESRLDLLLTFHCHAYYFDDSDDKNELLAVLWNVYNYYKQFVTEVNAKIAALKAPIEKKLKDFVKIARWNDINYWAVKETVEKTHRTLHKFVKEFQNALKQNVSSCLVVKSVSYSTEMNKGIWDDQDHRKYFINPLDFIVAKPLRSVNVKLPYMSKLIVKIETLLPKAKHLCKELVLVSSYPCVRAELENFIEDFLEQSARLRDMDVDRSLPKNKQKSQAKSILQQKRMTLANYFKALAQLGVSYRTGILALKNNADQVTDLTVSPLDLSMIGRYFKLKNIDQHMLAQWHGCEKYYYKSLIRLNALNAMLSTSQTDLGLQNMERCRGYSAHVMLMAHRQKMTIARSFDCFSTLRMQVSNMSETREEDLSAWRQRNGRDCADSLKTLLITLEAGFQQMLLFLQCCPATESLTDTCRAVLTLHANALPIIAACQTDEVWKNANALLENSLSTIRITAKHFHALFVPFEVSSADRSESSMQISLLSSRHFEFLEQNYSTIKDLRLRCRELRQLFESPDIVHPILEHIAFLDTKMECFLCNFENLQKSVEIEEGERLEEKNDTVRRYELILEQLINAILLVIQKKYKDHINLNDNNTFADEKFKEENNENDNAEEEIEENRLKERLVEALEKDLSELKLSKVSELFFSLLVSMYEPDLQSASYCTR